MYVHVRVRVRVRVHVRVRVRVRVRVHVRVRVRVRVGVGVGVGVGVCVCMCVGGWVGGCVCVCVLQEVPSTPQLFTLLSLLAATATDQHTLSNSSCPLQTFTSHACWHTTFFPCTCCL